MPPRGRRISRTIAALIVQGDAAVTARRNAIAATADQRAREILPFIDDVNAVRTTIYGRLTTRVTSKKRPRDWPDWFFPRRKSAPRVSKVEDDPAPAPAPTPR